MRPTEYHQPMFKSELIGPGLEVFDADWRALVAESLDISLMVLHKVNLSGSRLANLKAVGTGFDCCSLDGADLRGALIQDWTCGDFTEYDDPMEYLPSLASASSWEPDDFELKSQLLDDEIQQLYDFSELRRWRRKANIFGSSFRGSNLSEARLSGIVIDYSDFSGARLTRAQLGDATFEEVSLKGANLTDADLNGATFRSVDLRGANLSSANLRAVTMQDVILDGVIGMQK